MPAVFLAAHEGAPATRGPGVNHSAHRGVRPSDARGLSNVGWRRRARTCGRSRGPLSGQDETRSNDSPRRRALRGESFPPIRVRATARTPYAGGQALADTRGRRWPTRHGPTAMRHGGGRPGQPLRFGAPHFRHATGHDGVRTVPRCARHRRATIEPGPSGPVRTVPRSRWTADRALRARRSTPCKRSWAGPTWTTRRRRPPVLGLHAPGSRSRSSNVGQPARRTMNGGPDCLPAAPQHHRAINPAVRRSSRYRPTLDTVTGRSAGACRRRVTVRSGARATARYGSLLCDVRETVCGMLRSGRARSTRDAETGFRAERRFPAAATLGSAFCTFLVSNFSGVDPTTTRNTADDSAP
ncbi:hypothetical protein J421_5511 (plasmid) [Gemmatirosa kalamazoonensis]|uniref:Uncharacterized protein n=1 Tax=Gemmatirosa kalamazoonensis TaxID=861299 RepID=W0RQQ4_9BACT|nr:hypothetical protein J421_5511 [Gemmatirosa kalamazoonensis]